MEISSKSKIKKTISLTTKFFKAFALGLLLCTYTNLYVVNAKTVDAQFIKKEYAKAKELKKQHACLTRNIYFEAAGESLEGKIAVAQVTLNRVNSGKFPHSICEVVQQKTAVNEKTICQFSWYCENYRDKKINKAKWDESTRAANMIIFERHGNKKLKTALYFHNEEVSPVWKKRRLAKIGRHTFYGDKT